jgi:CheY-like chemotaxis protein
MKTILIVEDIELNLDLLEQLLEEEYELLVAHDGAQAVTMVAEHEPDLVLMDISLPVLDGYEATRAIRQNYASLPVIGLSAHAMKGDADRALAAGCNDYLTKPVDEELLLAKVRYYLR